MIYRKEIFLFLLLSLLCTLPVMGVTTYSGASPQMSAVLSGVNEFSPGQDGTISVIVKNSGISTIESVDYSCTMGSTQTICDSSGPIPRDDVPTTAKMVTVGLSAGDAPVVVKSDPQNIGDIPTQGQVPVNIIVKITQDATIGEYQLPLTVGYTYLAASTQPAADTLNSIYVRENVTFPITIKITPTVLIKVTKSVAENLSVGTTGYLDLTLVNMGSDDGREAIVKVLQNGNSPVIPIDSSIFIGDFPRNQPVFCRYEVAASSDAQNQTYPVDVAVTYENIYGDTVTSEAQTIGVPVQAKITFSIASATPRVTQGSDSVITVQYQNTGTVTAYHAESRLSAVDPFSSTDNTAYLGDLKPGDMATARYDISTGSDAAVNNYALDTVVSYQDSLDNNLVSDTFKVPVQVVQKPTFSSVVLLPVVVIIVLLMAGAGYYLLGMRKKK